MIEREQDVLIAIGRIVQRLNLQFSGMTHRFPTPEEVRVLDGQIDRALGLLKARQEDMAHESQ